MDLKRVIINEIIILSLQVILYFGCEYFQKKPKNIATEFDKKIPVLPLFTLIYILWFPLIAIFPINLFLISQAYYKVYIRAWILDIIISIIIYMAYPTTFERPKNLSKIKYGWMLKYVYKYSYKGVNCMPSMHCSISTLVLLAAIFSFSLSPVLMSFYILVSVGIIVSTIFTKQHVILDLITGVLLGAGLFFLFYFL